MLMQDRTRSKLFSVLNEYMSNTDPWDKPGGSTVEHDISPYYRELPRSLTRQHDFLIVGPA